MTDQTIICPNCGKKIPLTETLSHQIKESLIREFDEQIKEKEREIEKRKRLLDKEAQKLEESKKTIEHEIRERLKTERTKLLEEARKEVKTALEVDLRDLKEQIAEKDKRLEEAHKAELSFRKKMRELEEQKKSIELEVARKIDAEKEKIRQHALEIFSEEHRLKDLEKDKIISDMRKTIEDLKRKSEQGSIQTQGEVLEMDMEEILKTKFPYDDISPVPKGTRGADILQKVYSGNGQYCGSILWETKRTKSWSNGWISKLKDDQREIKAEIAVIATEAMPKEISSFALINGVWVTDLGLAGCLAGALRSGLIQVSQARMAAVSKDEKMEVLYKYLSGPEFKQKVEAIVEAFKSMKEDLEQEKRAMLRIWSKREKEIERVITNTVGMYGDMQGIIGTSMPKIKML
ncbi:MAG: DUF2130 domain-containing protein, partial [Nitrospirota bacterium]